jgi:hypothetical protein
VNNCIPPGCRFINDILEYDFENLVINDMWSAMSNVHTEKGPPGHSVYSAATLKNTDADLASLNTLAVMMY